MASWLAIHTQGISYIPLKEWIFNFVNKFWKEDGRDSERVTWFCAILWAIWSHRNNVVFKKEKPNPYEILRSAEDLVTKEKTRLESGKVGNINNPISESGERVTKISFGSYRGRVCEINVDGAWKSNKWTNGSRAGIGWIARIRSEAVFKGNAKVRANSSHQT